MTFRFSKVLLCLCIVLPILAQRDTGTIAGTVKDPSGSVAPNVNVTVIDQPTNSVVFSGHTDNTGTYRVPALKPSTYTVKSELTGFRGAVHDGIILNVDETAIVDFSLQVGQAADFVEVTGDVPLLRTESAELGDVVEQKRVVQLPLNGRFFVNMIALTPGVMPAASGTGNPNSDTFLGARAGQPGVEANGQRPNSNNYTIDGIDNEETMVTNIVIYPPIDAIQEFKVQTSNQEAEFGKSPGATVNVVIRSGTNVLHGNVYEFLRNNAFDAKNFFDRSDRPIPTLRLNQYGFTAGGPIKKNRTFIFGYWEGYKIRQAQTYVNSVPTALMRTGSLSELNKAIYDPLTLNPSTNQRQIFPGAIIPPSRLDHAALGLMQLNYPLPNRPGTGANYVWNPKRVSDSNSYGTRVDHRLSEKDSLFGRFMLQNFTLDDPAVLYDPILPNPFSGNTTTIESDRELLNTRALALGHTHLFTPQFISEERFGYTRERQYFPNVLQGTSAASAIGIANVNNPAVSFSGGLPLVTVSGFSNLGESNIQPLNVTENNFQYTNSFTWIRGSHAIRFGALFIRRQMNFFQANNQRGNFAFDGSFTSQIGVGGTGSGLADFLVGYPLSSTLSVINNEVGQRQFELGAFIHDTWKVTPRLSLTYGLRYELSTPRTEVADRQANFNPAIPGGGVVLANSPNAPCGRALRCLDAKDFAPRLGFAYRIGNKWVIRGGYGIYYDDYAVLGFGGITTGLMVNPPFWRGTVINNSITSPSNKLEDGVPPVVSVPITNGVVTPVPGILYNTKYQNPYGRNAYVQERNFTVEHEFAANLLASVSYVGNKGNRLMYTSNVNQALPGPGAIASRRPFPAWPDITSMYMDGQSSYNSLQAKLEKRLSKGLSFVAGYTFAKALDDAQGEPSNIIQSVYDLNGSRGRTAWDVRQRFILSGTYELPFVVKRRVLSRLVNGWSINPILALQTGFPFTPTLATPVANTGTFSRPDRIASGILNNPTPDLWFDTAAFTTPALYHFGNSGRGILTGPGTHQIDANFQKDFAITHDNSRYIQFRAELFNITNTPQFNNPNVSIGTATAGKITGAGDSPNFTRTSRQIQFGLKLYF